ncbi:hypothetical protein Nepgr_026460 [Nepenthes gracilis]|uniref:BHLH domain-containing protein n=1 Tax=Nepenthes gracilis TaxID=150966 RepID=A0AAD3T9R5_NEPGR|nr:hypothetical protein Nepgr_026460 [Nepenthes gracilis]
MDGSSSTWFEELGMDCYNLISDYQMNSFEPFNTGQQQSLSAESYSSCTNTTAFNSNGGSHHISFERPTKLLKTDSWNSSPSSSTSHILSFAGLDRVNMKPKDESAVLSQGSDESQSYELKTGEGSHKRVGITARNPSSHAQDHIMAERRRREKLSQRFIALSAVVPGLKKMDKASVLGDAIKHLKQLQDRVKDLEEQAKRRAVESAVLVRKSRISTEDGASLSDGNFRENSDELLPEIEARVSDVSVLIRIHCERRHGLLAKVLSEVEKLHLTVINSSALQFGNHDIAITIIAQMGVEFSVTAEELVKKLRFAF